MKKKLLSLIIMCIMAVSIFFTGCSCTKLGLTDNPPTNANTTSNGGMTVIKGDYLYYINGYLDETNESELDKDGNKFGKITRTGIYRTKLENGKIQKDQDGFLVKSELVVSKVVGFSNGGFYIIDDYIYYTTPYMNLSNKGKLQTSRVEFHRINIDGTDDKTIYTTDEHQDNLEWSLYKINDTVYLTTYVSSKIIIVNTATANVVTEISNSTSHAMLTSTEYKTGMATTGEFENYIYYTRAIATTDNKNSNYKGNVMCKVNIATGEVTTLEISDTYTYAVHSVSKNAINYFKTNAVTSGIKLLYTKEIAEKNWTDAPEIKLSNANYSNYFVCGFGDNLVIADDSNGTYLLSNGVPTKISSSQKTVLKMNGNVAYYINSNKLYSFDIINGNITDGEIEVTEITSADKTHSISNANDFDFDGQRVYVFAEYTSKNETVKIYLDYVNNEGEEKFVGVFDTDDIPAKPEQDENYGKADYPDVKYIPWID